MSSQTYPITTPAEFTFPTASGDGIIFNADGPATALQNRIIDFVTTEPGDLLYRNSSSSENAIERLAIGTSGQVLTVSGTSTAQISTVTTVADSGGSLNNTYFLVSSPTESYYVWFDVAAGGTDPATNSPIPADLIVNGKVKTGVQVSIATNDTAITVADAIRAALPADFTADAPGAALITITNASAGAADATADGATATSFTIANPTPGSSLSPTWAAASGGLDESFSAGKTVTSTFSNTPTTIANWNVASDATKFNTGSFNATTGVFTAANTGKFSILANINYTNTGGGGTSGSRTLDVLYNGATVIAKNIVQPNPSSAIENTITVQIDANLTAADTIELQFYRSNGAGTNTITTNSTFSISKFP